MQKTIMTMTDLQIPALPLHDFSESLIKTIRGYQETFSKGKASLAPVDELPPGLRVMILCQVDFWRKDNEFLQITDMRERNAKRDELFASHPFNDNSEEWPWENPEKLGKILKWLEEHP